MLLLGGIKWRAVGIVLVLLLFCVIIVSRFLIPSGVKSATDQNNDDVIATARRVATREFAASRRDAGRRLIPKIMHQVFDTNLVIDHYLPLIRSCLLHNPDWKYYLWRDSDARLLIRRRYPQFARQYDSYRDRLQRSDIIRYMVLHTFGGIYLDMDVECKQAFPSTLTQLPAFLDQERFEQSWFMWGQAFSAMNSCMGSRSGHPFFLKVISESLRASRRGRDYVMITTGPLLLTQVWRDWNKDTNRPAFDSVALLHPVLISPGIDASKRQWIRSYCGKLVPKFRSNKVQIPLLSWRERACHSLWKQDWNFDISNSSSIAEHRFSHLGYRSGMQETAYRKLDLISVFPGTVHLYSQ